MDGTEYLSIVRARELDTRNRTTTAQALHRQYTQAVGDYAQAHGERPSGLVGLFSPSRTNWETLDIYWAGLMSGAFEQLRIAVNRAIEGIGMARQVTGPAPSELTTLLPALGRAADAGRSELTWYASAPVSRHDPQRPFWEQFIRTSLAAYPGALEAVQQLNVTEAQFTQAAMNVVGAERAPDPEITLARQRGEQDIYAESQASGLPADPSSSMAQAGRSISNARKDVESFLPDTVQSGAEFTSRTARSLAQILGTASGRPGGGLTIGDSLALVGLGTIVVAGAYLYVKTRPALTMRRNPESCE